MNTEYVLVLRTCNAGLISYGGFKWPESGPVAVAHVGENGIKPNTPYRLTDKGEFQEVTP